MTNTTKTKTCNICGKTLPVTCFHARADSVDGLRNRCIECERERNRATYLARKRGKPIPRVMPTRYDRDVILQLAREGYTSLQIAEKLGCNRTTVYKALKHYDITLKVSPNFHAPAFSRVRMRELLEQGYSQTEVARRLGCSASVVSRYVAEVNNVKVTVTSKRKRGRAGMTCAMNCSKYPCFRGIDNMSSNLALTCIKFERRKR